MPRDLLDVAAESASLLELHGIVACGRRIDGVTSVDFWTHGGQAYSLVLDDEAASVEKVVARCLAAAGKRSSVTSSAQN